MTNKLFERQYYDQIGGRVKNPPKSSTPKATHPRDEASKKKAWQRVDTKRNAVWA